MSDLFGVKYSGKTEGNGPNGYIRLEHETKNPILIGLEEAQQIVSTRRYTNVQAVANSGKITISLIDFNLAVPDQKLVITSNSSSTLAELGLTTYSLTQTILCPHTWGPTEFGNTVKFNEYGSFVVSAPTGTRFEATTFDFVDNEYDDDTVFDNNTTQFIDYRLNAGAAYYFENVAQVPVPGSLWLVCFGIVLFWCQSRRKTTLASSANF